MHGIALRVRAIGAPSLFFPCSPHPSFHLGYNTLREPFQRRLVGNRWIVTAHGTSGRGVVRMSSGGSSQGEEPTTSQAQPLDDLQRPPLKSSSDTLTQFRRALRTRNPVNIFEILTTSAESDALIASLPGATFLEILGILDPEFLVRPYRTLDRHLNERPMTRDQTHKNLMPFEQRKLREVFGHFKDGFLSILTMWKNSGHTLGIVEYTCLLNYARVMGDSKLASATWEALLSENISPDRTAYNHYMEAMCWSRAYLFEERENLRVTELSLKIRDLPLDRRQKGFRGHGTGPEGLKNKILRIFRTMVDNGEAGDERTYSVLITALARDGDLDGVKRILRHAWNIDANILKEENDNLEPPASSPKAYPPTSPLYPTARLLYVIAHAFGTNNELLMGVRIVGFISQHYSVAIPDLVWEHLLEWGFTLHLYRTGKLKNILNLGRVPPKLMDAIWSTLLGPPYNVKPTMPMYHYMIKHYHRASRFGRMQRMMGEALPLRYQSHLKHAQSLLNYVNEASEKGLVSATTRRHMELAAMEDSRDDYYVRRWVRSLIVYSRWGHRDVHHFQLRVFPDIMKRWKYWLSKDFYCETDGFSLLLPTEEVMSAPDSPGDFLRLDRWEDAIEEAGYAENFNLVKAAMVQNAIRPDSEIYSISDFLRATDDDDSFL